MSEPSISVVVLARPVHQVLWGCGVQVVFLRDPHVDDPPLVVGVDELVRPLPLPVRSVLLRPFPVDPADEAGDGHPEDQRDYNHGSHHIVLEELEEAAHADLVYKVPDPHDVLTGLLTHPLVAEALEAGGAVGQDVHRSHGVAGAVEIAPAAPLARVRR